jgi:hypothetical protein
VIGVALPRGDRVDRLIYYLYGPGRHEEHTDPHLVAGWRHPAELEPPLRPDGRRDFRQLTGLLKQPHAAMGNRGFRQPVWHVPMRTAPGDKMLSDEEWAQIAWDVMSRTGLCPPGQEDDAVRWVAVRHGPDHIHIVAMLARQDRRRVSLQWERRRLREACRAAEECYGLRRTQPACRTVPACPSRAETEKAARNGRAEPPRVTLRRMVTTAAAASRSDTGFFDRLAREGVMIRTRMSVTSPGQVTGYAVALPGDTTRTGEPVWYSGGKLAPDLTWPRLRKRWTAPGQPREDRFTPGERAAIWEHAARTAAQATRQVQDLSQADPGGAADTAWAAGDLLHVAAAATGSRLLHQAADAFDRAARPPYARIPPPTPAGSSLRRAARLISAYAYVSSDRTLQPLVLLLRAASLAEAIAGLHQSQQRAAQAASALSAARHLHTAAGSDRDRDKSKASARNAAELAAASFPVPARPAPPGPGTPARPRPAPSAPRPGRRHGR